MQEWWWSDTYIFKITVSDESLVEMLWSECLSPPDSYVKP